MGPRLIHALESPFPTVADLLTLYEREYLPHQALDTQRQKRALFRWFRRDLGTLPLADLTPAVLRLWRDQLAQHLSPGSVSRYMLIVSSVLTVAVDDLEWLPKNPMRQVKKPAVPAERVRFLDDHEQRRLLDACQRSKTQALYPVVLLAMTTGLRRGEVLTLRWTALDLVQSGVQLVRTKTGLRRNVPMPSMTRDMLCDWQERQYPVSPYVFPARDGLKPASLMRAWYLALARAHLENFRFNDLRHTAASYLAMAGVRIEDIAEILGHRSIQTTRRYRHLAPAYTAELVEKMAQQFIKP